MEDTEDDDELNLIILGERDGGRLAFYLHDENGGLSPAAFTSIRDARGRLTDAAIAHGLENGVAFSAVRIEQGDYFRILRQTADAYADAEVYAERVIDFGAWALAPFHAPDRYWDQKVPVKISSLN